MARGELYFRATLLSGEVNFRFVALHAAGNLLKLIDPEAADIFYRQICDLRPCPPTG